MLSPFFAAVLTLDVTLISAVVGLLVISISTIWSFFQMKQKLEAQVDSLRLSIQKNKDDNIQLRKDALYSVISLQERLDEVERFLSRSDQNPRFARRSSSSQMTAKDFLAYSIKSEE